MLVHSGSLFNLITSGLSEIACTDTRGQCACLFCPLSGEDSSRPQRSALLHKRIKWLDKKEGIILSVGLSGHLIKGQLKVLVLVMQAWILHKVDVILGGDSH